MSHKTHDAIESEIFEAQKLVKIGGIYSHYKRPENHYKVVALATQEASGRLCVIYQAEYGNKLFFVRDVDSWLDKPEVDGRKVHRFKLIG